MTQSKRWLKHGSFSHSSLFFLLQAPDFYVQHMLLLHSLQLKCERVDLHVMHWLGNEGLQLAGPRGVFDIMSETPLDLFAEGRCIVVDTESVSCMANQIPLGAKNCSDSVFQLHIVEAAVCHMDRGSWVCEYREQYVAFNLASFSNSPDINSNYWWPCIVAGQTQAHCSVTNMNTVMADDFLSKTNNVLSLQTSHCK